jgi:hypothetical protein
MFLHHARETRLVTAYLLIMLALVMVPRPDGLGYPAHLLAVKKRAAHSSDPTSSF